MRRDVLQADPIVWPFAHDVLRVAAKRAAGVALTVEEVGGLAIVEEEQETLLQEPAADLTQRGPARFTSPRSPKRS